MNTQPSLLWVLLAGALILGTGQACAPTATTVGAAGAETQPATGTETTVGGSVRPPQEPQLETATGSVVEPMPSEAPSSSLVAAGSSPTQEPLKENNEQILAPARTVTDIEVQPQGEGVSIIITGDGELTYQAKRLDGNRLVIDLMDVANGSKQRKVIRVGHQLIRQVRIGSHQSPQPKLRIVLDLERSVPYTIEKTGAQLRVSLSDRPASLGTQEALGSVRKDAPAVENGTRETLRHAVPLPVPERLNVRDSLTALAQPKPDQPPAVPPQAAGVSASPERFTGKRVSLDFQDAEISSVLRLIADVSGLNMVVGDAVRGKVTLKLLNVPWDQALDLILKLNNLGQIREGNIIWIDTLANITKLRDEAVRARDSTMKAEDLTTRIVYLNFALAAQTLDVAKSTLSPRGEIKVDVRTNALVVRDIAENLNKLEKLIHDLDQRTPQVQIEARIVQATKTFARGLGIQWGISNILTQGGKQGPLTVALGSNGATPTSGSAFGNFSNTYLVNLPAAATGVAVPASSIGFAIGKFFGTTGTLDMQISAGESMALAKIVSSPKILTLDNKAAKIEQGDQVPFQTVSLQGTQTTFVDATLTLSVTPHVVPHASMVRLEIKATKNAIDKANSTPAGPSISKKEATTEVLLRDGETTVLGGIFEEERDDNTQGIPWFNRIPFLGWLFKNEGVSVTQSELLVFVTPLIVKD
jgi:type IV pilus assembly protein PilQ